MWPSRKSILAWFAINGGLVALGTVNYLWWSLDPSWPSQTLMILTRSLILIQGMKYLAASKPTIQEKKSRNQSLQISSRHVWWQISWLICWQTGFDYYLCMNLAAPEDFFIFESSYQLSHCLVRGWFLFVGKSLFLELVFDFCHYWFHRFLHSHPVIYRWIHKTHHAFSAPQAESAFYMSLPDFILSHELPLFLSMSFLSLLGISLNQLEFMIINVYLAYQEIGGHLGKIMYPTSSFAQFVWLPRWCHIELYTEDHDRHHQILKVNYAKRFSVWDRLFDTYEKKPNY